MRAPSTYIIRGGHVVDPSRGIDGIADIGVRDNKIVTIEEAGSDAFTVDAAGLFVSPGWVDIHVHVYGQLGFADPDSIGIYQGVTTYVEAGGPGIETLDEFRALMDGRTETGLYAGCYISPLGIVGIDYVEGEPRSLYDLPVAKWLDRIAANRDVVRYLKMGAFSGYGTGPLKIGKGLAEMVGLPLYVHIGEFQLQPGRKSAMEIYNIASAGDIVTHVYHGNANGILDEDGAVLPSVLRAREKGVLFDVGFGGFNFSWDVAERASRQGFWPDTISSDLQQFNVLGPVCSLSNVMSVFLALGMPLADVIARVTARPAAALGLDDRAGSLAVGMPADITVFRIDDAPCVLGDTYGKTRDAQQTIVPVSAFKNGVQVDCDLGRCQDERNWILQIAEDHIPAAARDLTTGQIAFLRRLHDLLGALDWPEFAGTFDLEQAIALHRTFRRAVDAGSLPLRDALLAVLKSFLDEPFSIQVGVLLMRMGPRLVLGRLKEISAAELVSAE